MIGSRRDSLGFVGSIKGNERAKRPLVALRWPLRLFRQPEGQSIESTTENFNSQGRYCIVTGLRIASPIEKAAVENACKKLQESGLFASISYRYASGPKHGCADPDSN